MIEKTTVWQWTTLSRIPRGLEDLAQGKRPGHSMALTVDPRAVR